MQILTFIVHEIKWPTDENCIWGGIVVSPVLIFQASGIGEHLEMMIP